MNNIKKIIGLICIALGLFAEYYLITAITSGSLVKNPEENMIFTLTVIPVSIPVILGGLVLFPQAFQEPATLVQTSTLRQTENFFTAQIVDIIASFHTKLTKKRDGLNTSNILPPKAINHEILRLVRAENFYWSPIRIRIQL